MKIVYQRFDFDCGAACIAMLADVRYETAWAALYGIEEPSNTSAKEVMKALRKFDIDSSGRLSGFGTKTGPASYHDLEDDAILATQRRSDETWHWVVWDASKREILDPRTNNRSSRKRFYHYMTISRQ